MIKQFCFKQFNLALVICLQTVLFEPYIYIRCYNSGLEMIRVCDGNEEVLCISQSSSITRASSSDCLMSYIGHSLGVDVCRDAFNVFYTPSRQGCYTSDQCNQTSLMQLYSDTYKKKTVCLIILTWFRQQKALAFT